MYQATAEDVNTVNAEERLYQIQLNKERARIKKISNPVRRQQEWNKLRGIGVALNGLSEEQLSNCEVW